MPEFLDGLSAKERLALRNRMMRLNERKRELEHLIIQVNDERLGIWNKLKMSDKEIAEILCKEEVRANAYRRDGEECIKNKVLMIKRWRNRNNLKPNSLHSNPFESVHEQRKRDYAEGLTDSELGDKWGLSLGAVYAWRNKFGLSANPKREEKQDAV